MTTVEQVQKHEQRLAQMSQQIAELDAEAESLGNEIAVTLAAGRDATVPRARRFEVRQLRTDLTEAAALLEQRLATDREAAGTAEAEKRMVGVVRAYGSVRQELDEDEAKAREAAVSYQVAAERVNDRYRSLARLQAEAGALADRFGVAVPDFPSVVIPAMREGCAAAAMTVQGAGFIDHAHIPRATEKDEHGLRTRRTYEEITGTPAYEIITAAGGPRPWPALTERQRAIVVERGQQQAQEAVTMQRFAMEADRSLERSTL
ncbi:MAG: hypothetical protein NTY23_12695 [Chloroflexi bacterium]|nr:hypothetical protein [Chloroflexota bacterium]